jgi:DNA-binding Xre family transcriptional regulator
MLYYPQEGVDTMEIKIVNKINQRLDEYKKQTGVSKTFVAKQMNMSKQNMYQIFKTTNLSLETLIKFSIILKCNITDLFEYKIVD